MANTYSQITLHIVFAVKYRENVLSKRLRPEVFKYISGIITNTGAKSLAVGGYTDHIHILAGLPPTISVADFVRVVKTNSSKWINENKFVNGKFQWQEGYAAFSCSKSHRSHVIDYIASQEERHARSSFKKEYLEILSEMEIEFDEKYMFHFFD